MIRHTLDSESLVLASYSVDEVIVRDGDRSRSASDVRLI